MRFVNGLCTLQFHAFFMKFLIQDHYTGLIMCDCIDVLWWLLFKVCALFNFWTCDSCCFMRKVLFLELGCIALYFCLLRVIIFRFYYNWVIFINSRLLLSCCALCFCTQAASVQAESEAAKGGSESRKIELKTHFSDFMFKDTDMLNP